MHCIYILIDNINGNNKNENVDYNIMYIIGERFG